MQCSVSRWYYDAKNLINDTVKIKKMKLFRQRVCLVATLDAVRGNDPPGAVSVPNHSLHAQHYHYHLQYFYQPTANPNLAGIAKTVRPREKSFISAISRFQIPEQPLNVNDVRGQEMSEKTLLSFQKSVFCLLAFSSRRVVEHDVWIKCAPCQGDHTLERATRNQGNETLFISKKLFF